MTKTEYEPEHVVLAAGGTRGHLFAAIATAELCVTKLGIAPVIVTDLDATENALFKTVLIPHMPLKRGMATKALSLAKMCVMFPLMLLRYARYRPKVVVGFGGYTSFIPLLAAKLLGIPMIVHEQNSIIGRVNQAFLESAAIISLGFCVPPKLPPRLAAKCSLSSTPIRKRLLSVKPCSYAPGERLRILVIGGSQGAEVFDRIIPKAIATVAKEHPGKPIAVAQQSSASLADLQRHYGKTVELNAAPFFTDIEEEYSKAHLVICRAGASTIDELVQLCKPAIFIPLPNSARDHQAENAKRVTQSGGCWCVEQGKFCHLKVADVIGKILVDPTILSAATSNLLLLKAKKRPSLEDVIAGLIP